MKTLIETVRAYLDDQELHYTKAENKDWISLVFTSEEVHTQITITADEEDRYLCCRASGGFVVPKSRRREVAQFLCGVNYGLRTGGFQMDKNDGELFFQTAFFAGNDEITPEMAGYLIGAARQTHKKYQPGLIEVMFKDADGEETAARADGFSLSDLTDGDAESDTDGGSGYEEFLRAHPEFAERLRDLDATTDLPEESA